MPFARVSVTMPNEAVKTIKKLAARDSMPMSRKTTELVMKALEIEEDEAVAQMASQVSKKTKRSISHEKFWGQYGL